MRLSHSAVQYVTVLDEACGTSGRVRTRGVGVQIRGNELTLTEKPELPGVARLLAQPDEHSGHESRDMQTIAPKAS